MLTCADGSQDFPPAPLATNSKRSQNDHYFSLRALRPIGGDTGSRCAIVNLSPATAPPPRWRRPIGTSALRPAPNAAASLFSQSRTHLVVDSGRSLFRSLNGHDERITDRLSRS